MNRLLHAADDVMLSKYMVNNVAWHNGKIATSMPKPLFGDNGFGRQVHQSLWTDFDGAKTLDLAVLKTVESLFAPGGSSSQTKLAAPAATPRARVSDIEPDLGGLLTSHRSVTDPRQAGAGSA